MSDKPLAEQWDDDARREDWPANGDFLTPQKCAAQVRRFAAEHLTEQTEPSAELRQLAIVAGYNENVLPYVFINVVNATLRRIRELLVGKETK